MIFTDRRWTSDELSLYARDYAGAEGAARLPVIAIHGLTRNSADFGTVAPLIAATGRRVLALDVRGRGRSDRAADPMTYQPPVYAKDVLALLDQAGVGRAVFLGRAAVLQDQIARHAPKVAARAEAAWSRARRRGSRVTLAAAPGPSISLDRAVIEHSDRLAMIACDVGWRDVGCWNALWSASGRDPADNHLKGAATAVDSSGCLIWSGETPVTVIGMTDVVVVSTAAGILVMPRSRAQDVRAFNSAVDELGSAPQQGAPHDLHRPPLDLR